jgi:DNA-binding response OmpR family regulator
MPEAGDVPILLVEDDVPFATAVARYLRGHGHEVRIEPSAEGARVLLEGGYRPALVILDLNLPGDTGWSLLRGSEYGVAGRPPVVVVTATHVHSSWLRDFGVAGYLPKPFAMETLLATIRRATATGPANAGSAGGHVGAS